VQLDLVGGVLLTQATEGEEAEEQEAPNPIIPAWNEVIWGTLAFVILFVVMWRYAYPGIRKAMQDRSARIQADLDAAEQAKAEAAALRSEYEAKLAEARGEAQSIIEEARMQAETVRQERLATLDAELADRRAQADADIDAARRRAEAEIRTQVGDLAIAAAELVVERNLDTDTNRQLVENFIDRVGTGS
jgi:F-type H+-transporting ATPase subunit b